MTLRLSCADYGFPAVSHRTALAIIADLGYEGVDIGVFGDATHVTVASVVADPLGRAAQVGADVAAVGLVVADVFLTSSLELGRVTPTSRVDGDQAELQDVFRAMVAFAGALGVNGVTLLPGVVDAGQSVADSISAAAEGLAPLVAIGAAAGLAVSVEPHFGSCIETPESTSLLLEQCPGLTVTLDPSHFAFIGVPTASMGSLAGWTRHVQIRPGGPGVMQCKVPDDQIDLRLLLADLLASGYDGWVASEYVWMEKWGCDEVDNISESARLGERLRALLGELTS